MNVTELGWIVEGGGAVAVLAGAVAGFHQLKFSIPILVGLLAIYVGRKIRAGSIKV